MTGFIHGELKTTFAFFCMLSGILFIFNMGLIFVFKNSFSVIILKLK